MRVLLCSALLLAAAPALAAPCTARLHFVQEVIDKDLKTGFVGKAVHDEMAAPVLDERARESTGRNLL